MHSPRLGGFSYIGKYAYFLTLCADQRRRPFVSPDVVVPVLQQFRRSAEAFGFALVAYCFMPDHLHVLCDATSEASDLVSFVADAKQRSGYLHSKAVGGRLWQRGFYDHVLRDEDRALAVVRYVVSNPLRAGLVGRIGEYPFCGSDLYTMEAVIACAEMWNPSRRGQP